MDFLDDFSLEKKTPEDLARELEEIEEILEQIQRETDYRMEP